jgi:hypothetical protein
MSRSERPLILCRTGARVDGVGPTASGTATQVINRAKRRYSVALSEFEPLFLNGEQRSVNRKVQGSNPCPGAKSEYEFRLPVNYFLTAAQQQYGNRIAGSSN